MRSAGVFALVAAVAAAVAPVSNCPDDLNEVSLLNSGASYCITEHPCSGIYRSDKPPTKTACPAEGQVSSKGDRLIIKPTCCAIINNTTNVLGCVFEAAKYTCIAPSPAPIPTLQPLPPHSANAAEVKLTTTAPPTTEAVGAKEVSVGASGGDATTTAAPTTAAPTIVVLPVTQSATQATALSSGARRQWNIEEDNLIAIETNVPGRVFVSSWTRWLSLSALNRKPEYKHVTAVVEISGSIGANASSDASQSLIDQFTLTVDNSTIFVDFNASGIHNDGEVLVEIYVRSPLERIAMHGSAEAYVEAGVLASQRPLSLTTATGDLYIDLANVTNATEVTVAATGAGSVQLVGPTLTTATSMALTSNGDGSIVAFLQTASITNVTSRAYGYGDIHIYSTSLTVQTVYSSVDGSGSVVYASGAGVCRQQEIEISGVGNVESSRLLCVDTNVKIDYSGRGDAIVQSSNSITTDVRGPGNVLYFNTTPTKYPAYKKHYYEIKDVDANKLNESSIAWPASHAPNAFHVEVTSNGSWLDTVSVDDLDRIILFGCLLFLLLILLYILYRCYKRYKDNKDHGEYQRLQ
ncbi:hypothetical protein SPRG_09978 [Saprolegnia parasitica CBS 223.65]|uniref:Putative auto-transporter adhesin head GIN domain-containing protein n=1 Tax=Saprolegnia parasitica (strain CBS 223.65) TaxID=695850 RepID=A0A067C250_SAPPC|nr:hypothetical protein SPRG_09978 [Saprolegnia parasitica CBS 223.65]KDO23170.1 hypothetical protein SPRG_09978 [Saprolegnia parasitica CBS 223.65]|eukprot:XP_012206122.1 hypothetical protein SPRG_09978 [Saprolegnia parasitica CBS 223.65]